MPLLPLRLRLLLLPAPSMPLFSCSANNSIASASSEGHSWQHNLRKPPRNTPPTQHRFLATPSAAVYGVDGQAVYVGINPHFYPVSATLPPPPVSVGQMSLPACRSSRLLLLPVLEPAGLKTQCYCYGCLSQRDCRASLLRRVGLQTTQANLAGPTIDTTPCRCRLGGCGSVWLTPRCRHQRTLCWREGSPSGGRGTPFGLVCVGWGQCSAAACCCF